MTQLVNQFELGKEKGQLDLRSLGSGNVIQCKAKSDLSSSTPLTVGMAVKLVDIASGIPVLDIAGDTDPVFGYVIYALKKNSYSANEVLEVALSGSIMYMIAGAAVAAGAKVMHVAATGKVITATGATKIASGLAIDKAAADTDLIRVYVKSFGEDALLGLSGTITFYAAATSAGSPTVLNTAIVLNGKVLSWTQA